MAACIVSMFFIKAAQFESCVAMWPIKCGSCGHTETATTRTTAKYKKRFPNAILFLSYAVVSPDESSTLPLGKPHNLLFTHARISGRRRHYREFVSFRFDRGFESTNAFTDPFA